MMARGSMSSSIFAQLTINTAINNCLSSKQTEKSKSAGLELLAFSRQRATKIVDISVRFIRILFSPFERRERRKPPAERSALYLFEKKQSCPVDPRMYYS